MSIKTVKARKGSKNEGQRRQSAPLLLLLSIDLLAIPSAAAFTPDRHASYAAIGTAAYVKCEKLRATKGATRFFNDDELKKSFQSGPRDEDNWTIERASTWHYMLNKEGMPSSIWFGLIQTSFTKILALRLRRMHCVEKDYQCSRPRQLHDAGRVLHYLQDARVPAHVIPLHHGSIFGHDEMDDYEFAMGLKDVPLDLEVCTALYNEASAAKQPQAIFERVKAAACATRKSWTLGVKDSKAKVGADNPAWHECFWCVPKLKSQCAAAPYAGFGAYRKNDGGPSFGTEGELLCGQERIWLDRSDYREFFKDGFVGMIKDTVWLLYYLETIESKSAEKIAAPADFAQTCN